MSKAFKLLQQRRSVPTRQLGEPAPDKDTLQEILEAAIRVPDHGKLVPFRLIALRGKHKLAFGEKLAELAFARNPDLPDSKREKELHRYTFAPLVIVVVGRIDHDSKVPALEQQLTAGAVAHNILLGAYAKDFGAQWLTGWAAYDDDVFKLLGLKSHENIIGFIHIGTPQSDVPDRDRPSLDKLYSEWKA